MMELWGMPSTPCLPLLPGPPWFRVVTLDRVLSIDQVDCLTFKQITYAKLNC